MTIRTFARVLPAVLVAGALLAPSGAAAAKKPAAPKTCNGSKALCSRTLDKVVLAGAHNAMSAASLGFLLPNQQVGIPDQLKAGIHGFLFDTYYGFRQPDGKVFSKSPATPNPTGVKGLYLCHEYCVIGASKLTDSLSAMAKHIRKNPNNVFVIVNEDYITPKDFAGAVKSSGLLKYVYTGSTKKFPTLRTMIQKKQQVVILSEGHSGTAIKGIPWYHLAYDGIVQETPYTFATPDLLTQSSNWGKSCIPNRGAGSGRKGKLFLMNHWAPPSAPDPDVSAGVNATKVLVGRAKACKKARGKLPNIVAVDMFQSGNVVAAVKQLNALK
jgi:hypothetical protein